MAFENYSLELFKLKTESKDLKSLQFLKSDYTEEIFQKINSEMISTK